MPTSSPAISSVCSENISAATGWHVFLDPDARHSVSAKFKDLPSGEALHMLLGNVNFMVVPRTNGASQLFVFRTAQRQATKRILAPPNPTKPIPRELVVTIKPGSKVNIQDLARSLHAKIIGRLNNSYLLQFADDASTSAAQAQLGESIPTLPPWTIIIPLIRRHRSNRPNPPRRICN